MIRKKRGNCFDFFPLSFSWLGERGTEIAPGEIMQCGICICPVKVSCAFQVLLHRPFPSFRLKSTKREKKLSACLCEIHQLEHRENVSCYRIIYALEQILKQLKPDLQPIRKRIYPPTLLYKSKRVVRGGERERKK